MATNNPFSASGLSVNLPGLLRHGTAYQNALGEIQVYLPERLPPATDEYATTYVCGGSERLQDIVIEHYRGLLPSPLDAVDVVAQYQEEPIIDTSIRLQAGLVLLLPPPTYFQEVAYGESLAEFPSIA